MKSFNPFVFEYKKYTDSPVSTMLSALLSGMQRVLMLFSLITILVVIFDDVDNWGEALITSIIMLAFYIIIRIYKYNWTDKLAAKESEKNV